MLNKTPIECHLIENKVVYVKREDLYSTYPAPSLAKLRGISLYVNKLKKQGIKHLGILDTRISKSGWGLAYLCQNNGIKVTCFYPKLKQEKELPYIQQQEKLFNADVIGLPASRTAILYSKASKCMAETGGFMMPMGLVLKETKDAVSGIITTSSDVLQYNTIVLSLGTGTIASGIIDGLQKLNQNQIKIIGVSCGMNTSKIKKRIEKLLNYPLPKNIELIEPKYEYYETENLQAPFPCSPYYDKKALRWLLDNYKKLNKPILFWNIGD